MLKIKYLHDCNIENLIKKPRLMTTKSGKIMISY